MGDNEIIKALYYLYCAAGYKETVTMSKETAIGLYEYFNRQKAEIERLECSVKQWEDTAKDLLTSRETAKAKAIKEFAERLKATPMRFLVEYVEYYDKPSIDKMVLFIDDNDIDNLVKEMVGDDNEM